MHHQLEILLNRQVPRFSEQPLRSAGVHHRRDLSQALASRNLLQVDQAKSVDQTFFRQLPERGQIPNLDCGVRLSHRRHCQEATQPSGIATAFTEYFRGQHV